MEFLASHDFNAIRLLFNHYSLLAGSDPETFPPLETDGLIHTPELQGAIVDGTATSAQLEHTHGLTVLCSCVLLPRRASVSYSHLSLHCDSFTGKSYLEMFLALAREAASHGMLVMMACHRRNSHATPTSNMCQRSLSRLSVSLRP